MTPPFRGFGVSTIPGAIHPYYKGEICYRGVSYPGTHEPLVDPDTWQRVQDLLSAHNTAGTHQRTNLHYLRGSVYCGSCGHRLMVTTARNKWGTEYPYLICSGRTRKVTDCQRQAMPIGLVEELIEDEYRTIALSQDLSDNIEELILEDFDTLHSASDRERKDLDKQRAGLVAQRQKLLEAHYANAIPLELLKTEQDRIAKQLSRIQNHLATTSASYDEARRLLADTLDLTRDCRVAYLQADDATRRLFNQAFFTNIYIDEDDDTRQRTIRVDYNQPFDDLLSRLVPARVHRDLSTQKAAHQAEPAGGTKTTLGIAEDQSSHTSTLVVLARQLSNEHLPIVLTTNRGVASWGDILGDTNVAAAMLGRHLHRSVVLNLDGDSYRLRDHHAKNQTLRHAATGTRRPLH